MLQKVKTHLKNFFLSYFLIILAIYFLYTRGNYTFLDLIDLLIHEPSHLLFGIFGEVIHFLGGTLMQILLPLLLGLISFIKKWKYTTQFLLFWLGHNFINVSVYVEDAI